MSNHGLTQRQEDVYNYIRDYISKFNKSPYIREIQEACGVRSYKTVLDRLFALEKKGYICRKLNKHRSIVLNNI